MPTPTHASTIANRGSAISQHLRAVKDLLRGTVSDAGIDNTTIAEARVLEQDTSELLRLIKSWGNSLAPINRVPPEVLTLIPDFWNTDIRDRATITLTHVCRAWREIFTSRSALWTDFDCEDIDKTLVYLDRSGSSPINVWLDRYEGLSPYDPFIQVIPHIITRLKSMVIRGTPENLEEITTQLSTPAPLLETLTIDVDCECSPQDGPIITTKLFDGDLSSLRKLHLQCIRTELPWRNMTNLTSFTLSYTMSGDSSVGRLLDFFEGAPRLCNIRLHFATPIFDSQRGRFVTLGCLKRMDILGGASPSLFLDHLIIPVGAKLAVDALHPLKSLSSLWELSDFRIDVHVREDCPGIRFGGPNGRINVVPAISRAVTTCRVLESLAQLDPSKVERLRLAGGDLMQQDRCVVCRVLHPMKRLRTLTISHCKNLSRFIPYLDDVSMCPKLEELVVDARIDGEKLDTRRTIRMAETRASMLVKLKSFKIVSRDRFVQAFALKLKEYVPHVECSPRVALVTDDMDSSDEGE